MSSFNCEICGTTCTDSPTGYISGCEHYPPSAMGKRLSDMDEMQMPELKNIGEIRLRISEVTILEPPIIDNGLAEMKRMEYPMSKAPCVARLKELADWSEKKD